MSLKLDKIPMTWSIMKQRNHLRNFYPVPVGFGLSAATGSQAVKSFNSF